jgi:hypothetical protein
MLNLRRQTFDQTVKIHNSWCLPHLRHKSPKPMAFHASRRISAAAGPKLSSLFAHREVPKPRPPLPPESSNYPPRRKPRPRPRQPWGEDAAALLRRLHEGRYLPGPDLSMAAHVVSPDAVKTAAERFGNDHQVVAKWVPLLLLLVTSVFCSVLVSYIRLKWDHRLY